MGSVASAALLTTPVISVIAEPARMPMWAVGTYGEYNWMAVAAPSREGAVKAFLDLAGYEDEAEYEAPLDVQRCASWDVLKGEPSPGDWLRAGMSHVCSRCNFEISFCDGRAVADEAVCDDCMTLADWDIVDPEYAAEIREDWAEEISLETPHG